jgi:hypothetical protein
MSINQPPGAASTSSASIEMCEGCTVMVDAEELVGGAGVCRACTMGREWAEARGMQLE